MRFWKVPVHIANKVPEGSGTKTFQDLKKLLGITHGFICQDKPQLAFKHNCAADSLHVVRQRDKLRVLLHSFSATSFLASKSNCFQHGSIMCCSDMDIYGLLVARCIMDVEHLTTHQYLTVALS